MFLNCNRLQWSPLCFEGCQQPPQPQVGDSDHEHLLQPWSTWLSEKAGSIVVYHTDFLKELDSYGDEIEMMNQGGGNTILFWVLCPRSSSDVG